MFWCISIEPLCHGKDWKLLPKNRSTKKSPKRKCPHRLMFCAKDTRPSLRCILITAEVCDLRKPQITCTSDNYSEFCSEPYRINTTTSSTGPCWNRKQRPLPNSPTVLKTNQPRQVNKQKKKHMDEEEELKINAFTLTQRYIYILYSIWNEEITTPKNNKNQTTFLSTPFILKINIS